MPPAPVVSPNPLGPDAPDRDYVGLAFAGMAAGIMTGTAVVAMALFLVRTLQAGQVPSTTLDLGSAPATVLLLGTLAGVLAAAGVTWVLLAPIRSTYRQGGLAMVAAFATVVVSLLAAPADRLAGRAGLLTLAAVAAFIAWRFALRARREAVEAPEAG
jgi:hypothetical protein